MSRLTETQLRTHPELAMLLLLTSQLELLPQVFASVHSPEDRDALAEQARSMARVCKILADQTRAYVGLVESDICEGRRRRR